MNAVYTCNGVLFNHETEWNSETCYNMDECWKHAEWNITDMKGQILWFHLYEVGKLYTKSRLRLPGDGSNEGMGS